VTSPSRSFARLLSSEDLLRSGGFKSSIPLVVRFSKGKNSFPCYRIPDVGAFKLEDGILWSALDNNGAF
jgi:hypothetical protein